MKIARTLLILALAFSLVLPASMTGQIAQAGPNETVEFTILHTNDFHGRLTQSPYIAGKVNEIRTDLGADNVLLLDAGDVYFAAPAVSQLLEGESAIDIYNLMGYQAAAYGNHEFDLGQEIMIERTTQSDFPWLGANIIVEGTEWDHPDWADPYVLLEVGGITVGVIGLGSEETPDITIVGATEGIYFKSPTETILHYYDEILGLADALVVLAHQGTQDTGEYQGLVTVAQEVRAAGKPVDLMIGGHQHEKILVPVDVDGTKIVAAGQYGENLGRLDLSVNTETKKLTIDTYTLIPITNAIPPDPDVADRVAFWLAEVAPLISEPIGVTHVYIDGSASVDRARENLIGDFVTDAMLWWADMFDDGELNGSIDAALTNPGGNRANLPKTADVPLPYTITWGDAFDVLPFFNTMVFMDLTGAQIQEILDQSASLERGIMQVAGASYYYYNDTRTAAPNAWGAYGIEIRDEPLVRDEVYRIVTNSFLAGGGDSYPTFTEGANIVDTGFPGHETLIAYIEMMEEIHEGDIETGRAIPLDNVVTILHTNDTHGNWAPGLSSGDPMGMSYLASIIKDERSRNPNALLLDAGDTFQGNSFAYFFKDRPDNPIAGGMNLLDYDAFVIGNHEYNFGPDTFATMLGQLEFPILGSANVEDPDNEYAGGFINTDVVDYINVDVEGLKVSIFGLTNPRVYRYELPTNIPGLTFHPVLTITEELVDDILATEAPDLLVGLTHIGFAPYADEIDSDKLIAENIPGIDVLIGGHSHTKLDPAVIVSSEANPDGTLIAQAQRYALFLGKVNIGLIGGEVVLREGYLIPAKEVEVDPDMAAYLAPYLAEIDEYNQTEIGVTTTPIDALDAFTQETNAANLQADAAVWALRQAEVEVDFHLSGAMTNRAVATTASATEPYTLTVGDMFTLMPYENSLVVIEMNGPQIKRVLERAYRNYYYYKYVPDRGGYSFYTTCMLDINSEDNQIVYRDTYPSLPSGNNVLALQIGDEYVDFEDEETTYNVSTVNYLAAGSCNFNDAGETIWPLENIVADTQNYVRDVVISYIAAQEGPISPQIEGRLAFMRWLLLPVIYVDRMVGE
jgi:2',3'-cyclic-nucleotide 2'-phosphodiesterase / 3'-nucleotidase / 5'-nucleotidase